MDQGLRVQVIGGGIVGKATALGLMHHGHAVRVLDINPERINTLSAEGLDAAHVDSIDLIGCHGVLISVPTPTHDGTFCSTFLEQAVRKVGVALRRALDVSDRYITVVIRSTVPPGTTERLVVPMLEQITGAVACNHFGVAYNPEFLRAEPPNGNPLHDFLNPPLIVYGAIDPHGRAAHFMEHLYRSWGVDVVGLPSAAAAEFLKEAHNASNAATIALGNELFHAGMVLAESLGIAGLDEQVVRFVLGGVLTKTADARIMPRYGFRPELFGQPYGGMCLTKDPPALLAAVRRAGGDMPIIAATITSNEQLARAQNE